MVCTLDICDLLSVLMTLSRLGAMLLFHVFYMVVFFAL